MTKDTHSSIFELVGSTTKLSRNRELVRCPRPSPPWSSWLLRLSWHTPTGHPIGRAHGQTPRLGPRASALQCGELAETLQVPRKSPHERGKVPAVVVVAAVTAGTAVVIAAAAAAIRTST